MKITYKGDYALKALFQLSLIYGKDDRLMSINEIAKLGDMPQKFLEQILFNLKKGGFVKSKRGLEGGFFLARPPKEINIGEVVRFIEGPIGPISCIAEKHYKGCKDLSRCIFRDVWGEVNDAISDIIDNLTFEELVSRYKAKKIFGKTGYDYTI